MADVDDPAVHTDLDIAEQPELHHQLPLSPLLSCRSHDYRISAEAPRPTLIADGPVTRIRSSLHGGGTLSTRTSQGRSLVRRVSAAIALTAAAVALAGAQPASAQPQAPSAIGTSAVTYDLIRNANSAKCLDVADGSRDNKTAIAQYTCDPAKSHQQWTLEQVGDGSGAVRIKVAHSGKCVDVWDSSQDATADATQYTCSATKFNQQFLVEYTGSGTFKLRARHSGQCLEIAGRGFGNKAKLHQNWCVDHRAQEWLIG
jgi:Ricin-type beta-trefoil lectin domain-like